MDPWLNISLWNCALQIGRCCTYVCSLKIIIVTVNNIDNFVVKEFKEKSDQQNTSKRRLPLNDFVIRAKENEVRIFMFTCCACVHIFWLVQQCTEECL